MKTNLIFSKTFYGVFHPQILNLNNPLLFIHSQRPANNKTTYKNVYEYSKNLVTPSLSNSYL